METNAGSFTPLLIVISLAFIVPLLLTRFRRLRLPIVVGEILAGIVVGRSGFGWVSHEDELLSLLAEFGFVFLMFLAGMEIDFSNLKVEMPAAARAGGGQTGPSSNGASGSTQIRTVLRQLDELFADPDAFHHSWLCTPAHGAG